MMANAQRMISERKVQLNIQVNGIHDTVKSRIIHDTGELGYDGLNGTREIGPSYAKSGVYI